ncbi:MAG: hypothetical protein WC858_01505 [Parcubacteria group bacterium]|jgi:hypothetical protein
MGNIFDKKESLSRAPTVKKKESGSSNQGEKNSNDSIRDPLILKKKEFQGIFLRCEDKLALRHAVSACLSALSITGDGKESAYIPDVIGNINFNKKTQFREYPNGAEKAKA